MKIENIYRIGALGIAVMTAMSAACSKEEPAAEQHALPASVASHQVTISVTGMT